jgi:ferredoxin-type protein NapG
MEKKRRKFIQYSSLGILGLALAGGVATAPYLTAKELRLRPPGAVAEDEFLALCIKCGQCLQVCPYHSIELDSIFTGHGIGTPYINAWDRACYLCKALPCVLACPSGALDHDVSKPEDVAMGIGVLSSSNKCIAISKETVPQSAIDRIKTHPHSNPQEVEVLDKLEAFVGKQCTICADLCPYPNAIEAIEMVDDELQGGKRPQFNEKCVGCGVCEELCPTNAITIKPRLTYKDYYEKG